MRKGNIVILEGSELKVKLLRSIGRKDKDGQFWEIEFTDGSRDVRLLRERVVPENTEKALSDKAKSVQRKERGESNGKS